MKFLWYSLSLLIIVLILATNPKTSSINNLINQEKTIKLNSNNQLFLQRAIMLLVLLFFIVTILFIVHL